MSHNTRVLVVAAMLLLSSSKLADAATLALAWDRSPDREAVGYIVRGGFAPGVYPHSLDVGSDTALRLPGLPDGLTLYIIVEAYAPGGRLSSPSNEIVWTGSAGGATSFARHRLADDKQADLAAGSIQDRASERLLYDATTGQWTLSFKGAGARTETRTGLWPSGRVLTAIDFNGDNRRDFLLHDPRTGDWTSVIHDGDAYVEVGRGVWPDGLRPLVSDLNGDGLADVSLYDPSHGTAFSCISSGGGPASFACTTEIQAGAGQVPVDWNGTRQNDAPRQRSAAAFSRQLAHPFTAPVQESPSAATAPAYSADFDGDGRSDRLAYDPGTGSWTLALATAKGVRYERGQWSHGYEVHLGDLDADDVTDVLLYQPASGAWRQISSAGGVTSGVWMPRQHVLLTDLNGDRRADAVLLDSDSGARRLALWDAARGFASISSDALLREMVTQVRDIEP